MEANELLRSIPSTVPLGVPYPARTEALALLEAYAARVPQYAEPLLIAAELAEKNGDQAKAQALIERALPVYERDATDARRISAWYIRRGEFSRALPFLEDLVYEAPGRLDYAYDLAKVRYLTGDTNGAVSLFRTIYAKDPSIAESDPAFLAEILPRVNLELE